MRFTLLELRNTYNIRLYEYLTLTDVRTTPNVVTFQILRSHVIASSLHTTSYPNLGLFRAAASRPKIIVSFSFKRDTDLSNFEESGKNEINVFFEVKSLKLWLFRISFSYVCRQSTLSALFAFSPTKIRLICRKKKVWKNHTKINVTMRFVVPSRVVTTHEVNACSLSQITSVRVRTYSRVLPPMRLLLEKLHFCMITKELFYFEIIKSIFLNKLKIKKQFLYILSRYFFTRSFSNYDAW